jgi:hypothetical protein
MENTTLLKKMSMKEDLSKPFSMLVLLTPPSETEFSELLKEPLMEVSMFPITPKDSPDSPKIKIHHLMTPKFTETEFSDAMLITT